MDDKIQANLSDLFRRHFQEITPQSSTIKSITPDFKNLNSHPPGTKASVACTTASETKDTPQEKNTIGEDHSLLSTDTRFGGTDDTYDSNANEQQNVSNKKKGREDENRITLGNQNSDDSYDDKGSEDEDIATASRYAPTIKSTN